MTIRDELVELLRQGGDAPATSSYTFLRTHGSALVEALNRADRYEAVRKMSVVQFSRIYTENITTGIRFDDLVDAFARGDGTKIEPDKATMAALRDAERYRWIRSPNTPTAEICLTPEGDGSRFLCGVELDQAIDAARGES